MIQPSNKYFIGTIGFTTKKSCANYTRMIVNALDTRIIVNESHIHFTFLCDLIQNHPDSGDKIGAGIKHFIVTQNYINKVKEGTEAVKLIELLKNTGFRVETIQIEKFCYFRCVK